MIRNVEQYFRKFGDVVVMLKGNPPIVATMDFDNDYIQRQGKPPRETAGHTMFSWTDNRFRQIKDREIKKLQPMHDLIA